MTPSEDEIRQLRRAEAASLMLPWKQLAEGFAEHAGIPLSELEDASDDFFAEIMAEMGLSRDVMVADIPALQLLPEADQKKLLDYFGVERWTAENVRRAVREEMPLPLGPIVGGVFVDVSNGDDFPIVWAAATSSTDPKAMARTFERQCLKTFGKQAARDVLQHSKPGKTHEFTPEEMYAMHERGMSYKEIAIQTLRSQYPGIIGSPGSYKAEIKKERARIIWVIRAAQKLWSIRMPEDSTS